MKSSPTQADKKPFHLGSALFKASGFIVGILVLLWAVRMNKVGDNSSMCELLGVILLIVSACTLKRNDVSPFDFVIGAASGLATLLMAQSLQNGSMFELGGGVVLVLVTVFFFKHLSKGSKAK